MFSRLGALECGFPEAREVINLKIGDFSATSHAATPGRFRILPLSVYHFPHLPPRGGKWPVVGRFDDEAAEPVPI